MYEDMIFENALSESKERSYECLKTEISTMEDAIEKFLNNILECTASISERDFHVMTL